VSDVAQPAADSSQPGVHVALSVVAPVYNEAEVVAELVRRIDAACRLTGKPYEIVIADDCSTDDTGSILHELTADPDLAALVHARLPENGGQWVATSHGMRTARGDIILTIDGDLQDPPETIPALVKALDADANADVCFAVKTRRSDPLWFRAGMVVFKAIQSAFARTSLPAGAGAFVAIRRPIAQRAAAISSTHVNLAPVLAALQVRAIAVPYEKRERYDGTSRVGPWGLVKEAAGSLVVTGAMERMLIAAAVTVFATWGGTRLVDFHELVGSGAGPIDGIFKRLFIVAIGLFAAAGYAIDARQATLGEEPEQRSPKPPES